MAFSSTQPGFKQITYTYIHNQLEKKEGKNAQYNTSDKMERLNISYRIIKYFETKYSA